MKVFKQEETLSPWQIQNDSICYTFVTDISKDSRSIAFTAAAESPSKYASLPLQKKRKQKNLALNTPKIKVDELKNWKSASLLPNRNRPPKQRPGSSNLKNQLRKYLVEQDQFQQREENRNRMHFTPLNLGNNQSTSSVRRGVYSARPLRGKSKQKICVRGIRISQNQQQKNEEQYIDFSEKMCKIVKEMSKQSRYTQHLNLNRFVDNYTKEQIKLQPVCLKLKLNK